jgi:hypothetical protein
MRAFPQALGKFPQTSLIVSSTRFANLAAYWLRHQTDETPQIAELDCNPFVVHEDGAVILDARMRVEAVEPRPLLGVRG